MHATLRLRPLRRTDGDEIATWFQDAETCRHMAGMLPLDSWLAFALSSPTQQVWMAVDDQETVGLIQIERETATRAWLSLMVHPAKRQRGYAREMARRIMAEICQQGVREIHCEIAADNVASLRGALGQGFVANSAAMPTPGFRAFVYRCSP